MCLAIVSHGQSQNLLLAKKERAGWGRGNEQQQQQKINANNI